MFNWIARKFKKTVGMNLSAKDIVSEIDDIVSEVDDGENVVNFIKRCIDLHYHNEKLFNEIYKKYLEVKQKQEYILYGIRLIRDESDLLMENEMEQLKTQKESASILRTMEYRQFKELSNRK